MINLIKLFILILILIQSTHAAISVLFWCGFSWCGIGDNPYLLPNYLGQELHKPKCEKECTFTGDKNRFSNVDAIMFEAQPMSKWGYQYLYDQHIPILPAKEVGQTFIHFGYEHETYFPFMHEPNFMNLMDFNMTFRGNSQVVTTFACSWGSGHNGSITNFLVTPKPYKQKVNAAAFLAANCEAGGAVYRNFYIIEMMKHMQIDCLGSCMHNKDLLPEDNPGRVWDNLGRAMTAKIKIFSRYKFSLAFENNNMTDYISEKVFTALLSGTLPIYMGAPNIDEYVPENSIVKTSDFGSAKELCDYLNRLTVDEQEYNKYFEWKKKDLPAYFVDKYNKCIFYSGDCSLCKYLHKMMEVRAQQESIKLVGHRVNFGEPDGILHSTRALQMYRQTCLTMSAHPESPVSPVQGYFTMTAWVNPESLASRSIMTIGDDVEISIVVLPIDKQKSSKVRSYVSYCVNGDECIISETPLQYGQWRHIAVTVHQLNDHTEITRIYIHGVLDITDIASPKSYFSLDTIRLGCLNSFEGKIDDIVIWRRELDEKEIKQSMYSKYRGNEDFLALYMTFNDQLLIEDYSIHRYQISHNSAETFEHKHKDLNLRCCSDFRNSW